MGIGQRTATSSRYPATSIRKWLTDVPDSLCKVSWYRPVGLLCGKVHSNAPLVNGECMLSRVSHSWTRVSLLVACSPRRRGWVRQERVVATQEQPGGHHGADRACLRLAWAHPAGLARCGRDAVRRSGPPRHLRERGDRCQQGRQGRAVLSLHLRAALVERWQAVDWPRRRMPDIAD